MPEDGFDWAERAEDLSQAAQSDADFYRLMANELLSSTDHVAVDFGCGAGGMAQALHSHAAENSFALKVFGLDANPEVYATTQSTHPEITFAKSSFEDGAEKILHTITAAADIVWARGALHHAKDEQGALNTLAAILAPGGKVAVAEGGTTVANLPNYLGIGEPGIQQRLDHAVQEHVRQKLADQSPLPYGWPVGLRRAGLDFVTTRNVMFDKPAPLEGADLDYVLKKFDHYIEWVADRLNPDDRAVWKRLLDPDDQFWLGNRQDLYYLAAASVHIGQRPTS